MLHSSMYKKFIKVIITCTSIFLSNSKQSFFYHQYHETIFGIVHIIDVLKCINYRWIQRMNHSMQFWLNIIGKIIQSIKELTHLF